MYFPASCMELCGTEGKDMVRQASDAESLVCVKRITSSLVSSVSDFVCIGIIFISFPLALPSE